MLMVRFARLPHLVLLACLAASPALADALDDIKSKGEIAVGVKADYKPFGFRDAGGDIKGFEIDIATAIAKALGVKPRFEPVQDSWVLLYPEGMVRLNTPAAEILRRCDGHRSVDEIVAELEAAFLRGDLHGDVLAFLAQARERGWVQ